MTEVRMGTPHAEIVRRLRQCLGDQAYSESHIYRLCREFAEGSREDTCRRPGSGRPQTATNQDMQDRLLELIQEIDSPRTGDMATRLGISDESVRQMLQDKNYR